MASISRQLSLNGFRGSARARRDMGMDQPSGRKGRSRKLSDRDDRDLGAAFNRQLTLRNELADQAVVARVARCSSRVFRAVCLGGHAQLV